MSPGHRCLLAALALATAVLAGPGAAQDPGRLPETPTSDENAITPGAYRQLEQQMDAQEDSRFTATQAECRNAIAALERDIGRMGNAERKAEVEELLAQAKDIEQSGDYGNCIENVQSARMVGGL